jgi:predicted metalloprotease with PDZ domain
MRAAYAKYSGAHGYSEQEFRTLVEDVAGTSLELFWSSALEGTGEIAYADALDALGLRFKIAEPDSGKTPRRATLGALMKIDGGRLVVSQVRRGTPAHDAGLNVDDEILAIDDFRVRADQLDARMEQYVAGDRVAILVARRDRLSRLELTLGAEPAKSWQLELDPSATAGQRAGLDLWLAPSGNPVGPR